MVEVWGWEGARTAWDGESCRANGSAPGNRFVAQ